MISKEVEFEVTQEHIDHGKKADCENCPVAICILEQLVDGAKIEVDYDGLTLYKDFDKSTSEYHTEYNRSTPKEVRMFVTDFDYDWEVEPFKFSLFLPMEFLKRYNPASPTNA